VLSFSGVQGVESSHTYTSKISAKSVLSELAFFLNKVSLGVTSVPGIDAVWRRERYREADCG
jgi:hypothetical protein